LFELFEFDKNEKDRRWIRIRDLMSHRGIDTLVIWAFAGYNSSECANFRYLSNMPTYGNLSYPGYLVFPLEGEPTIIGFAKMPGDNLWIKDIRGKIPAYSTVIIDRLHELHLEKASIGIVSIRKVDGETGFPYATYMSLREGLPEAHFEDAVDQPGRELLAVAFGRYRAVGRFRGPHRFLGHDLPDLDLVVRDVPNQQVLGEGERAVIGASDLVVHVLPRAFFVEEVVGDGHAWLDHAEDLSGSCRRRMAFHARARSASSAREL